MSEDVLELADRLWRGEISTAEHHTVSHLGGLAEICAGAATKNGFVLVEREERLLPSQHRYLPPPTTATGTLATRMKHEIIFTFRRQ